MIFDCFSSFACCFQITNDRNNNVHPEDWKLVDKCLEWLRDHKPFDNAEQQALGADVKIWMLYCSVNIPRKCKLIPPYPPRRP